MPVPEGEKIMAKRRNYGSSSSGNGGSRFLAVLLTIIFIATAVACGFGWFEVSKLKKQLKELTAEYEDKYADKDKEKEGDKDKDETSESFVIVDTEDNGIKLLSALIPVSAYEANGVAATADSAYTLTAEVYPENATD